LALVVMAVQAVVKTTELAEAILYFLQSHLLAVEAVLEALLQHQQTKDFLVDQEAVHHMVPQEVLVTHHLHPHHKEIMAVAVRLGVHNMVAVAVVALLQLEAMEHLVQVVMAEMELHR
jgi:hypothetical protein